MKRIKIIFSVIAIVAIISVTLAFNAGNKGTGNRYCDHSPNVQAPSVADYNQDSNGDLNLYCTTVSGGTTASTTIKVFRVE
jgi:hypothetical protein